MKYLLLFVFILTINCSGNKVTNYHGIKMLEKKYDLIVVESTNKNDLLKIIGNPSSISDFDKNTWFYIERLKTNQTLFKLGNQKIKKNNILVVKLNKFGIVEDKRLLNINNMNDLKYLEKITEKEYENKGLMYGVLSSLREKINSPMRNR